MTGRYILKTLFNAFLKVAFNTAAKAAKVATLAVVAWATLFSPALSAEELKVGYINTDQVFRESSAAVAAQNRLQQEFSKREKELVDLSNSLKADADKFDRDAPTLSDSQRSARQRQLVDQDRELQRKKQEFQEDVKNRKNDEFKIILDKTNKVIKQMAESEKYDILLQQVVYINPKLDITAKVIKALNAAK
jgi:outer membrane protein